MIIDGILPYFFLLDLVIGLPHINLYFTEVENENELIFEHDCIYVGASIKNEYDPRLIIPYCLSEWSSKWTIDENRINQKLSFTQLYKENVSSEELYFWSAPMDLIERYQLYVNEILISNASSLINPEVFYNCTLPKFGSECEYSFDHYDSNYSSVNEITFDYYENEYNPINMTCYVHLECDRAFNFSCLDWSEVCDGYIDCLNDGIDEKYCWQFQINECDVNEHRCDNGQCIPKIFYRDSGYEHQINFDGSFEHFECLDRSDEIRDLGTYIPSTAAEPTFAREDVVCAIRYRSGSTKITNSCIVYLNVFNFSGRI